MITKTIIIETITTYFMFCFLTSVWFLKGYYSVLDELVIFIAGIYLFLNTVDRCL